MRVAVVYLKFSIATAEAHNGNVHRAAAKIIVSKSRAARGSVCNVLLSRVACREFQSWPGATPIENVANTHVTQKHVPSTIVPIAVRILDHRLRSLCIITAKRAVSVPTFRRIASIMKPRSENERSRSSGMLGSVFKFENVKTNIVTNKRICKAIATVQTAFDVAGNQPPRVLERRSVSWGS